MDRWNRSLLCLLMLVAAMGASAQAAVSIRVITDEWRPWVDPGSTNGGAFVQLVKLVGRRMGVDFALSFRPWKRAEHELREGQAFAAFPYRPNAEREAEFWFSDPIVKTTMVLFTSRGSRVSAGHPLHKLADLRPYLVGGLLGAWYQSDLEAVNVDVEWTPTLEASFEKLKLGRVDVVPAETGAGWVAASKVFGDPALLDTHQVAESDSDFRLMVSRTFSGARELLERFNRALAEERTTAQWRAIIDEVHLSP